MIPKENLYYDRIGLSAISFFVIIIAQSNISDDSIVALASFWLLFWTAHNLYQVKQMVEEQDNNNE